MKKAIRREEWEAASALNIPLAKSWVVKKLARITLKPGSLLNSAHQHEAPWCIVQFVYHVMVCMAYMVFRYVWENVYNCISLCA